VNYQKTLVVDNIKVMFKELMNGLTIKDILMLETNDRKFTHDEVVQVAGEYLKCKKTGKWVSATNVENYENEWINIEIEQFYERQADKYY
jgi:hypothetical protein